MPVSSHPVDAHASRQLLVADSFRARSSEGVTEVRGFSLHLARFRQAFIEADAEVNIGSSTHSSAHSSAHSNALLNPHSNRYANTGDPSNIARQLDEFLTMAASQIAAAGEGFPRLEGWARDPTTEGPGVELSLAVRPLPPIRSTIELRTAAIPPSVSHPARKGPNISAYAQLGRELGCEGLLVDAQGLVAEGTTTSLVWWDASGRGFVSASAHRVPSVTEALVVRSARDLAMPLRPAKVTPPDLVGCEVWAVNALHGLRLVLSIDGQAPARHDPDRLAQYRAALNDTWEPIGA